MQCAFHFTLFEENLNVNFTWPYCKYIFTIFKSQCQKMMKKHEDDILEWLRGDQEQDAMNWLCKDRILKDNNIGGYKLFQFVSI